MTNNKQQTAVEWLWEIAYNRELTVADWKQAKEMEKDRIIDAHYEGQCDETEGYPLEIAQQYYNETFGGNK